MIKARILVCAVFIAVSPIFGTGQVATGGGYSLEKTIIANGGGKSAATGYEIDGTAGQIISDQSSGSGYSLTSGFWQSNFAPTAAAVSISGKVRLLNGLGLPNAVVILTDQYGAVRNARTNPFGFYRFDELEAGQTIVIAVSSKQFEFLAVALSLSDNIADLDFVPIRQRD